MIKSLFLCLSQNNSTDRRTWGRLSACSWWAACCWSGQSRDRAPPRWGIASHVVLRPQTNCPMNNLPQIPADIRYPALSLLCLRPSGHSGHWGRGLSCMRRIKENTMGLAQPLSFGENDVFFKGSSVFPYLKKIGTFLLFSFLARKQKENATPGAIALCCTLQVPIKFAAPQLPFY